MLTELLSSHEIITGSIFLLGALTVYLSIYSCIRFHEFREHLKNDTGANKLSRAISWQLAGEAIIGIGTLLFATAEFIGWLDAWNFYFTSSLRFTMFIATSLTTLHLVHVLTVLKLGLGSENESE